MVRPEYTEDDIQEFTDNEDELAYDGFYYLKGYAPKQTRTWVQEQRKRVYIVEVDPITCNINRLKDEEQTPEIIAEIEILIQERVEKVQEIKDKYPYPDGVE